MKLINTGKAGRALAVRGARAKLRVMKGESIDITEQDAERIRANKVASQWLKSGYLSISGGEPQKAAEPKAEPAQNETIEPEVKHVGAGRYNVFLKDEKLSDESLSKEEAENLAESYANS